VTADGAGERPGLDPAAIRYGSDGLIAAVVQDDRDDRVLMVGWQDAEAVEATLRTGDVHFRSRSRGRLWRKGETSGNVLRLVDATIDCDADAVLLRVRPVGPTCHTGTRSCFDPHEEAAGPEAEGAARAGSRPAEGTPRAAGPATAGRQGIDWLEGLWAVIEERARTRPEGSYTSRLLAGGVDAVARKVAEEATEVVLAAKDHAVAARGADPDVDAGRGEREALAGEAADLLYHLLVLLAERGLEPHEVVEVLRARHRA
jgi:phosphoribosyl-AMP cyclohydrolase / phosphoribosyl-ATP pyrophosphohydrolase